MFSTIIAGVDGRAGGRDAIALGAALSTGTGARLILAHTVSYGLHHARAQSARAREQSQWLLGDQARAAGVNAQLEVVVEETAAAGLARLARAERADLVVVGSPHRGALGRAVLGDDTRAVLDAAACPVAVAPAGWRPEHRSLARIGVGYDDTPQARRALHAAAELAHALNAGLEVIDVVEPPPAHGGERPIDARRRISERRERARRGLERAIAGLAVPATAEIRSGGPAEQLAASSAHTDLLVVGSHARGALGRLLYGSASNAVLRDARCPVIVVPTPAPQPLGAAATAAGR